MKIVSSAFKEGEDIPSKYTCDGDDVSPPLEISDLPEGTDVLALVMDDPDAPMGTFIHWLMWNIPKDTTKIEEGVEPQGAHGRTDFGRTRYGGPCPPSGTHTYRFKLYALSKKLDLREGATKRELEKAMKGYIIEESVLTSKYRRR